ncbi:LOW QUALITY PROTEIN: hypothetical protein TorRG33x02_030280 [Trema orientale]|uniref:Uncharacterized protein n=1 Tax=Trema orientale TaxID=63057 RepID=A0A2P5FU09_TREOI|nr:LOW QUALITY PROTEIN: hypothetical protein TorRG33x02_030280 [Trema orientale]
MIEGRSSKRYAKSQILEWNEKRKWRSKFHDPKPKRAQKWKTNMNRRLGSWEKKLLGLKKWGWWSGLCACVLFGGKRERECVKVSESGAKQLGQRQRQRQGSVVLCIKHMHLCCVMLAHTWLWLSVAQTSEM